MSSFSHQLLYRLIARIGWAVLLTLALAACETYPEVNLLCGEWNGRTELRPLLDGTDREVAYCVFADGTECHLRQLYYGTCMPPGANAPLSPVPTPSGGLGGSPLGSGFDDMAPAPSLTELLDRAPLIFIGTIGPVKQYSEVPGFNENGVLVAPGGVDDSGNPLPGAPITDFYLEIEEVIRDDGAIASGQPIILRMLGHATEELKQSSQEGEYPVSYTGDRYLFLLSPYPDGETYGFYYGPWSRLIVDGDMLRVSNGRQQSLQFGEGAPVTLEELAEMAKGE